MPNVLLISDRHLKDQALVESNVDAKVLAKVIHSVQEIQLKQILGSTLYGSLIQAVADQIQSGTTLSETYTEVLNDYVKPWMVWAVAADFLILNQYKVTNKGVLRLSDDGAESVSLQELEALKNYYDNNAASFKLRLIDHLKKNSLVTYSDNPDTNISSGSIGWFIER
ncbi:hypothetical protein [Flaviaesturariibacter amylovorans]|uniref:Uncharacterized protein n=1 Tax=Flaviaesturariibacter amylovorans TaxID=1084520 RepID=A0ABP8GKX6_9BACT